MANSSTTGSPTNLPTPYLSIGAFVTITVLYSIAKYMTNESKAALIFFIYILALLCSAFFFNLHISTQVCGSPQTSTVLFVTLLPWLIIFGLLNVALIMFPGWLKPFSNTFGYGIAKLRHLQTAFNDVLKPKNSIKGNVALSKALEDIYNDPSLLINEIPNANVGFDTFWSESKDILRPDVTAAAKERLRDLVKLKNIVAQFMWFLLTGILTISASYNFMLQSSCSNSVQEMQARHNEYEQEMAADDTKLDPTPRVYTSYE